MSEALAKIGAYIKHVRTEQGLNVKDLAEKSRVSYSNIINIEEGIRDELPEDACLNGFIKILLKTLKVEDQDLVLADYQEALGKQSFVSLNNAGNELGVSDAKPISGQTIKRIGKTFILFFLIVLVFGAVLKNCSKKITEASLSSESIAENKEFDQEKELTPKMQLDEKNENTKNEDIKKEIDNISPTSSTEVKLKFEIVDSAWFQLISIDSGKVLYEGDVFPNFGKSKFEFSDKYGFVLASGNAAAFKVLDSSKEYVLGKKNQLIKWFYPESAKDIYYQRREAEKKEIN